MSKKRLGQHFLYDPSILLRILEAAHLSPEDTVVEIGPGPGRMTAMLADRVKRVVAIELDKTLYGRLVHDLSKRENIELVQGDALDYRYDALDEFKVVANIPYYITTPMLFTLLKHKDCLRSITITVQKEVAVRMVARPGGKEFGVLSLMVQFYGKPELKFIVPKGAFRPVPKVDSALVHIRLYDRPPVQTKDEPFFFRVIKTAFSQRRKMLANSLRPVSDEIREKLLAAGIEPTRRPETLSIEEFAKLADRLLEPLNF